MRISSAGLVTIKNFNGTGLQLQGSGGDYQGMQLQTTDSSASQTRNIFIDTLNELGNAVANQVGSVQSDGGSAWIWQTQPAGNRNDRRVERLRITSSGNVGINQSSPTHKLEVNGSFAATTKSFVIDHPTKEGMKLRYGSLEGPENGVYVRGRLKDNNKIELPDYWTGLVDEDTITVNLTPIGSESTLHKVVDIYDNKVVVISEDGNINCFYTVFGERKDVEKMEVEY